MDILESLKIEGRSGFQVLCYGVFNSVRKENFLERNDVYVLDQPESNFFVVLRETIASDWGGVPFEVLSGFKGFFSEDGCEFCFCTPDGVFFGLNEIFSIEFASQYYAISMGESHFVLNLDDGLLNSSAWLDYVVSMKARIEAFIS